MTLRHLPSFLAASFALAFFAAGCGPSSEEWEAKLKDIDTLKAQLSAERQAHQKTQTDYGTAKSEIEKLTERLHRAGADVESLNANLADQRKALEDYKRRAEQLEAIKRRFDTLKQKLDTLTRLGLTVSVRKNRMVISMPGDVLFDSGKVELKKEGQSILHQVAEVIRNDAQLAARTFQVAGHTDAEKVTGGAYKDNWGLSVMRAREVLIYLVGPVGKSGGGLSPTNWSAVGYGETDPIAENSTKEGMKKNRRVELIVMPNVEEMLDLKTLTQ